MTTKIFLRIVHFFMTLQKRIVVQNLSFFAYTTEWGYKPTKKVSSQFSTLLQNYSLRSQLCTLKNETSFAFSDRNMHLQTCRIFCQVLFFFSVSHVKNRFWILILPEVNLNKTVRHEDDSLILFEHKLIYEHEELCTIFNSSEMHNRVAQDHITFYYTTTTILTGINYFLILCNVRIA